MMANLQSLERRMKLAFGSKGVKWWQQRCSSWLALHWKASTYNKKNNFILWNFWLADCKIQVQPPIAWTHSSPFPCVLDRDLQSTFTLLQGSWAPSHQYNVLTEASDCLASVWYCKQLGRYFKLLCISSETDFTLQNTLHFKFWTTSNRIKSMAEGNSFYQPTWWQVICSDRHLLHL